MLLNLKAGITRLAPQPPDNKLFMSIVACARFYFAGSFSALPVWIPSMIDAKIIHSMRSGCFFFREVDLLGSLLSQASAQFSAASFLSPHVRESRVLPGGCAPIALEPCEASQCICPSRYLLPQDQVPKWVRSFSYSSAKGVPHEPNSWCSPKEMLVSHFELSLDCCLMGDSHVSAILLQIGLFCFFLFWILSLSMRCVQSYVPFGRPCIVPHSMQQTAPFSCVMCHPAPL